MVRLLVAGLLATALSLVVDGVGSAAMLREAKQVPAASWRVNGRVHATTMVGNTVIVGGAFTAAISPRGVVVRRRNLAAFDMRTGALLTNWQADAGAPVWTMENDGVYVYVGGAFGRVDGLLRTRMAKIRVATGVVDPTFRPSFNGTVRAIDVDAAAVYVGGRFTKVNGATRLRIAKVSRRGTLDQRFRPRSDKVVWGLAKPRYSSTVFVSGPFSRLNGVRRNGVGAVRARTGATTGRAFAHAARPTLGLAVNSDGSRLYGAGGTNTNTAAAWNTRTGARLWGVRVMGDVQAIEYYRGRVYFGFHDGYKGNRKIKLLSASASTGAVDPHFRPQFNGFWGVLAIDVSARGVVAGGDFTRVGGVAARGWVRFRR